MEKIKINFNDYKDINRTWLRHKGCREWYYATGIFFDKNNNMYSFQYTLLTLTFGPADVNVPMIALTDYKNNKHYYLQDPKTGNKCVIINEKEASFKDVAECIKKDDHIFIKINHKDFSLEVKANYGKGAFWHCDDGLLKMGEDKKKEVTYYYSYTNMPSEAKLVLNGEEIELKGKTWFDRQGGTYNMIKGIHHWEWFSLRFFDDEEMMLFTFPRTKYYDGTYINKNGIAKRLQKYTVTPKSETNMIGLKWSSSWDVCIEQDDINRKEKHYFIEPIQEGHINFMYFEELCNVKDEDGNVVGLAFAELLPGVKNLKFNNKNNLFKRIEY